jgi:hypothetical protein
MAVRALNYTIVVGRPQPIRIPQGEDLDLYLTFINPPHSPNAGQPVDLTDVAASVFTVRDRQGLLPFPGRASQVFGDPTTGTIKVELRGPDTIDAAVQPYVCDLVTEDSVPAGSFDAQLLVASPFLVLQRVTRPGDPVTTPPAVPVVYGINWRGLWSSIATYQVGDGVQYLDPNGGSPSALSSFRALVENTNVPPLDMGGALSPDWEYVAQRGAGGNPALVSTTVQTGNYDAAFNDRVLGDPTGALFSVRLPLASSRVNGSKDTIQIKNVSDSPNAIAIALRGSDLIDGLSTYFIAAREIATFAALADGEWGVV